jgi:Zn-dependent peptidase ImmA (M78 family)
MFFLPRPPVTATLPPSFRHPPGDERNVGPAVRRSVRQARRMQTVLAEALSSEPPVYVPQSDLSTPPSEAASTARQWLGVTAQSQASWADDYAALRTWREALDERGIFVFSLEIGERQGALGPGGLLGDEVRGFSAWDHHAPLIVMNSQRVSAAARSFTLGHELAHLITRHDAACVESTTDYPFGEPVERWCEEFAAALLMPEPIVRAQMRARGLQDTSADLDDVKAMMRTFRVSARASALRLMDLGLAQRSLYGVVLAHFRPTPPSTNRTISSPPRSELRLRQYGARALDAVFRDVDDPFEALSILRMTVPDARRLAEQVPSAAIL